jgi:hypothetical protein
MECSNATRANMHTLTLDGGILKIRIFTGPVRRIELTAKLDAVSNHL